MPKIPERIDVGIHKGMIQCGQYSCLYNYGEQTGKIIESTYPSRCCSLNNPDLHDFGNGIWGCGDEIYGNEVRY